MTICEIKDLHKFMLAFHPVVLRNDTRFRIYNERKELIGIERIQESMTDRMHERMVQKKRFLVTSFEENGVFLGYRCYYRLEQVPNVFVMISTNRLHSNKPDITLSIEAIQRKGMRAFHFGLEKEPEETMWATYMKQAFQDVLADSPSLRLRLATGELQFI